MQINLKKKIYFFPKKFSKKMGNLLSSSSSTSVQDQVLKNRQLFFGTTKEPALHPQEIVCVQSNKPPGQLGYANSAYHSGVAAGNY
jgi:hypothetical protein